MSEASSAVAFTANRITPSNFQTVGMIIHRIVGTVKTVAVA